MLARTGYSFRSALVSLASIFFVIYFDGFSRSRMGALRTKILRIMKLLQALICMQIIRFADPKSSKPVFFHKLYIFIFRL